MTLAENHLFPLPEPIEVISDRPTAEVISDLRQRYPVFVNVDDNEWGVVIRTQGRSFAGRSRWSPMVALRRAAKAAKVDL
jgi:hypothetical protein